MKRTLTSAVALAFLLTLPRPAPAQDLASQLVGVWNLNSQLRKEVATGATLSTFGEKPTGHIIFTRGGLITFIIVGTDRKAPASPNLTDAERIELFKTMSFGSGTYKVEGNKTVTRYDTSWHQLWTGRDISAQAEIKGKTLTLTTEPFKAAVDGKEVVVTTIWDRVE
ncbi:MAG TPA: lipocalin-like domain-containing protein [Bradyrhizobium sp.]|nr:lipocalin-like domain-containing protein [Bradyrhizobium sp.]